MVCKEYAISGDCQGKSKVFVADITGKPENTPAWVMVLISVHTILRRATADAQTTGWMTIVCSTAAIHPARR